MVKCKICGNKYDTMGGYGTTYYIEYNKEKNISCENCVKKFKMSHFCFTNRVPAFCDGPDLITTGFDTADELYNYLITTKKGNDEILTIDGFDIVSVNKNKEFWWVIGHVNTIVRLPSFNFVLRKLGYKDK